MRSRPHNFIGPNTNFEMESIDPVLLLQGFDIIGIQDIIDEQHCISRPMNCIEFEDLEDIFRVMQSEESGSLLGNFNSRVQLGAF